MKYMLGPKISRKHYNQSILSLNYKANKPSRPVDMVTGPYIIGQGPINKPAIAGRCWKGHIFFFYLED
jgi:hypothetical protein